SAVLNAGYQVSLSHTSPTSLKTDAPPEVIWDIMRAWANMFPGKKSFELEPSKTIMSKESRHSRDSVVPTTMPVIKQRDTNEDCAKTLVSTENKLAEDANTSFIEEKSVKDFPKQEKRKLPKQGVKRVNGDLLPTKATQFKKQKKTTSLTIKEMFQRVSNSNNAK
ncbi:hypothetical protein AVEN_212553-1, partial [Araneus ventricosus]